MGSVLFTKESEMHLIHASVDPSVPPQPQWIRTQDGSRVCGRKLPDRNGTAYRCGNTVLYADGRCLRHSKVAPNARGDGYKDRVKAQQAMPKDRGRIVKGPVADAQERAHADKSMLDLRPSIALFDIRIEEISERIADKAASPADWKKAGGHLKQYRKALARDDQDKADYHLEQLTEVLEGGIESEKGWDEMLKTVERRAVRTEKAQDLLIKGAHMIATTDLQRFVAHTQDIIAEEARGPAATRIITRITEECLERLAPGSTEEVADKRALLPRIQRERARVHEGSAGGEVLEVSAVSHPQPVQAQERDGEDVSRGGEDPGRSGSGADVPDDARGQHRGDDGADRSPGQEPPVGGDREDAREGEGTTPGGA